MTPTSKSSSSSSFSSFLSSEALSSDNEESPPPPPTFDRLRRLFSRRDRSQSAPCLIPTLLVPNEVVTKTSGYSLDNIYDYLYGSGLEHFSPQQVKILFPFFFLYTNPLLFSSYTFLHSWDFSQLALPKEATKIIQEKRAHGIAQKICPLIGLDWMNDLKSLLIQFPSTIPLFIRIYRRTLRRQVNWKYDEDVNRLRKILKKSPLRSPLLHCLRFNAFSVALSCLRGKPQKNYSLVNKIDQAVMQEYGITPKSSCPIQLNITFNEDTLHLTVASPRHFYFHKQTLKTPSFSTEEFEAWLLNPSYSQENRFRTICEAINSAIFSIYRDTPLPSAEIRNFYTKHIPSSSIPSSILDNRACYEQYISLLEQYSKLPTSTIYDPFFLKIFLEECQRIQSLYPLTSLLVSSMMKVAQSRLASSQDTFNFYLDELTREIQTHDPSFQKGVIETPVEDNLLKDSIEFFKSCIEALKANIHWLSHRSCLAKYPPESAVENQRLFLAEAKVRSHLPQLQPRSLFQELIHNLMQQVFFKWKNISTPIFVPSDVPSFLKEAGRTVGCSLTDQHISPSAFACIQDGIMLRHQAIGMLHQGLDPISTQWEITRQNLLYDESLSLFADLLLPWSIHAFTSRLSSALEGSSSIESSSTSDWTHALKNLGYTPLFSHQASYLSVRYLKKRLTIGYALPEVKRCAETTLSIDLSSFHSNHQLLVELISFLKLSPSDVSSHLEAQFSNHYFLQDKDKNTKNLFVDLYHSIRRACLEVFFAAPHRRSIFPNVKSVGKSITKIARQYTTCNQLLLNASLSELIPSSLYKFRWIVPELIFFLTQQQSPLLLKEIEDFSKKVALITSEEVNLRLLQAIVRVQGSPVSLPQSAPQ